MAYRFKLEALLRYRQYEEERLQKELAIALRRCDEAAGMLNDLLGRRSGTESEMSRRQQESAPGAQFGVYVRYLQRLEGEIAAQRECVAALENAADQKRQEVLDAVKKRKTLEKLKEKGLKAYVAELDHEELKFINEIALNRFNSNQD